METRIKRFMNDHQITKTMAVGFIVVIGILAYAFVNGDWGGFNNVYLR